MVTLGTAVAGTLLLGVVRGQSSVPNYIGLMETRDVLKRTVDRIRLENSEHEAEIAKLKGSQEYARRVLRDKYHVTDPNETIVFFAD